MGLMNYLLAPIFSQMDIMLGDRRISQSNNCYLYCTFIELFLNYSCDMLPMYLSMGLLYKDPVRQQEAVVLDGMGNERFRQCSALTGHNRMIELLGPPPQRSVLSRRDFVGQRDIKIKLTSSKDSFC